MSKAELERIQGELRAAVTSHQELVLKMKSNSRDTDIEAQLHALQSQIRELSKTQKLVIDQLHQEILSVNDCTAGGLMALTTTTVVTQEATTTDLVESLVGIGEATADYSNKKIESQADAATISEGTPTDLSVRCKALDDTDSTSFNVSTSSKDSTSFLHCSVSETSRCTPTSGSFTPALVTSSVGFPLTIGSAIPPVIGFCTSTVESVLISTSATSTTAVTKAESDDTISEVTVTVNQAAINQAAISQAPISQAAISQAATTYDAINQAAISQAAISQAAIMSQAASSQTASSQVAISQAAIGLAATSPVTKNQAAINLVSTTEASKNQSAISQAAIGQAATSQAAVSLAAISQATISQAAIGQAVISQAAISQAAISQAAVSHAAIISQAIVHQAAINQAAISHATIRQAIASQATISQAAISQTMLASTGALSQTILRNIPDGVSSTVIGGRIAVSLAAINSSGAQTMIRNMGALNQSIRLLSNPGVLLSNPGTVLSKAGAVPQTVLGNTRTVSQIISSNSGTLLQTVLGNTGALSQTGNTGTLTQTMLANLIKSMGKTGTLESLSIPSTLASASLIGQAIQPMTAIIANQKLSVTPSAASVGSGNFTFASAAAMLAAASKVGETAGISKNPACTINSSIAACSNVATIFSSANNSNNGSANNIVAANNRIAVAVKPTASIPSSSAAVFGYAAVNANKGLVMLPATGTASIIATTASNANLAGMVMLPGATVAVCKIGDDKSMGVLSEGGQMSGKGGGGQRKVVAVQNERKNKELDLEERRKMEFMLSIGLVTPNNLKEMQNKRCERKRKSTANPQLFVYGSNLTSTEISSTSVSSSIAAIAHESSHSSDSSCSSMSSCCVVCQQEGGDVLMCDMCSHLFHMYCLTPVLSIVPTGQWTCPQCLVEPVVNQAAVTTNELVTQTYANIRAVKEEERNRWKRRREEISMERKELEEKIREISQKLLFKVTENRELLNRKVAVDNDIKNLSKLVSQFQSIMQENATV